MAPYLLDHWLPRVRSRALRAALGAYHPTALPLAAVAAALGMDDVQEVSLGMSQPPRRDVCWGVVVMIVIMRVRVVGCVCGLGGCVLCGCGVYTLNACHLVAAFPEGQH
jgi:hypothetical protein